MFVRLTCALTNRPLYLNPEHVVGVCPWRDSRGDDPEYTAVAMTDDAGAAPGQSIRRVLEPIDEVVARLSSGQFDMPAAPASAPAAPPRAAAKPPVGSAFTVDDRHSIGAAFAAQAMVDSDLCLVMDLYTFHPGDVGFDMLSPAVIEKAATEYQRIATTHPNSSTCRTYADHAAMLRRHLADQA